MACWACGVTLRGKSLFFIAAVLAATVLLGVWLQSTRTLHSPADSRIHLRLALRYTNLGMKKFQELCDDFNRQNPDVVVELLGIPGSYYDKLLVMFAGRTAPDVMWMGKGFAQFASRDAFLDVEDEFRASPNQYYEAVLDCYRFDGRLMGFPIGADFAVIVYNQDLFEQAGLPIPSDGWTLEDFRRTAKRLTIREGSQIRQWGFYGEIDPGVFGAEYLSPDLSEERINRPEWLSYFDFHLKMMFEDGSMPSQLEIPGAGILTKRQAFYRGQAAMISDGFHFQTLREAISDFRWDIAPAPLGVSRACASSTQGFAVSRHTRHRAAAVRLLKFLVAPETQRRMANFVVPSHRDSARLLIENLPSPPRNREVILKSMESLNPFPRHPKISELQQALGETRRLVLTREQSPAVGIRECGRQFQEILERAAR